jgi:hypothetical protein
MLSLAKFTQTTLFASAIGVPADTTNAVKQLITIIVLENI